ncbi:MAG: PilW family protein [Limisphaerales bacterium]
MKLLRKDARGGRAGMTLTEVMVAASLLTMVVAGVIGSHMFGLRMMEITKAKLGANDDARKAITWMVEEIRTAKLVKVGAGNFASFAEMPLSTPQSGNALQIFPTLDTNQFIRYYRDGSTAQLLRMTNGAASFSVVANAISNQVVFSAEDFRGNVLTQKENNRVIGLTLQFSQLQYPLVKVGSGEFYDFYQLRTKITRRALE